MPSNRPLQERTVAIDTVKLLRRILTISLGLNVVVILLHLWGAHQDLPPKALGSLVLYVIFLLLSLCFFIVERFFFKPLVQFINKYVVFIIFESFYMYTLAIWLKILWISFHPVHP